MRVVAAKARPQTVLPNLAKRTADDSYHSVIFNHSYVSPTPMEGLADLGLAPFLTKTFDMVDDPGTNWVVSWSRAGNSFIVWDTNAFAMGVLPRHFKHNNFCSFVRQLNTYGFRKVDSERWEFANEGFLRGRKHLLKTIRRRTHSHPPPMDQQSCNQFEQSRLRHDKSVLMTELVELRQEQQNNRAHIKSLEKRLQGTEQKQQQMMAFFAQLIRPPDFVHQLLQQKKRRRSTDQGSFYGDEGASRSSSSSSSSSSSHDPGTTVKVESEELRVFNRYQISELDILALEIQGFGNREGGGEHDNLGGGKDEGEMNDVFWEELVNEGIDGEAVLSDMDYKDDEDVIVLAEKLGYLKPTCPRNTAIGCRNLDVKKVGRKEASCMYKYLLMN